MTLTVLPGAMPEMRRARSRESFTGWPSTVRIASPALRPALAAGLPVLRLGDERALVVLELEAVGDVRRDRLDLDAEPAAHDRAVVLELGDDALRGRGRDGEGDADVAARRREDRGVDADDLAVEVEGRDRPELPRFTAASICRKSS